MKMWMWLIAGMGILAWSLTLHAEKKNDTDQGNATTQESKAEKSKDKDGTPRAARPFQERRRVNPPRDGAGKGEDDKDDGPPDGHRFRGKPGEGPGGPPVDVPFERIEQTMKFLKQHYPQQYERLNKLKENDSKAFRRQIMQMAPRMSEFMELVERDPELGKMFIEEHQLEINIRDEVLKYTKAADESVKSEIKIKMMDLIGKQFDIRQNRLKAMIADLERQLEQKKQALGERAARRDQMIDMEVQRRINPDI